MFDLFHQDENKNDEHEKQVRELEIVNEGLDRETQALLKELSVTPEQLTTYIQNRENFSDTGWAKLKEMQSNLDEELKTKLDHVPDPKRVRKRFEELHVNRQWLFVR